MKLKQSTKAANGSMGAQTQKQRKRLFPREKKEKATRRDEEKGNQNLGTDKGKMRCSYQGRPARPKGLSQDPELSTKPAECNLHPPSCELHLPGYPGRVAHLKCLSKAAAEDGRGSVPVQLVDAGQSLVRSGSVMASGTS